MPLCRGQHASARTQAANRLGVNGCTAAAHGAHSAPPWCEGSAALAAPAPAGTSSSACGVLGCARVRPASPAAPSKPCSASGGQGLGFPNPNPNPAAPGAAIRWAPESSNGAGWGCLCDLALQHANMMRGRVLPRQLWNPIEMPFGNRASFAAVLFCRRTRLADLLQPAGVPSTTGNCIWHCTLQRSAREFGSRTAHYARFTVSRFAEKLLIVVSLCRRNTRRTRNTEPQVIHKPCPPCERERVYYPHLATTIS